MNELNVAIDAAKAAGKLLMTYFEGPLEVTFKKNQEFLTKADTESEALILEMIAPFQYNVWSEEAGSSTHVDSPYRWVIDPLDGTEMFAHGIPTFGVAIALEKDGKPILAVSYFPVLDLLYVAQEGKGAYCNGKKIHVSLATKEDKRIYFITRELLRHPELLTFQEEIVHHMVTPRDFGCASLSFAYVAHGKIDASFSYHIKPCDIAGGILLVREAGGVVVTPEGNQATSADERVIAHNGHL